MGGEAGVCDTPGSFVKRLRLAGGTYRIRGTLPDYPVSFQGQGQGRTVLDGFIYLRSGMVLSDLMMTGGGVQVEAGEAPRLVRCWIRGNGVGLECRANSAPLLSHCTIAENSDGVNCQEDSSPILDHCTIYRNTRSGVYCHPYSAPILKSCIVWENSDGAIHKGEGVAPEVSYSCLDSREVWPGAGNINDDPLLCSDGWDTPDLLVSTQEEMDDALSAVDSPRFELEPQSPCLRTGEGGSNMGADAGICQPLGDVKLRLRLAPGTYEAPRLPQSRAVDLQGAGQEETILEGTLSGLRGVVVSDLTITGGGVRVEGQGEAPEILRCRIRGNSTGVRCWNSAPLLEDCSIVENSDHGVYCDVGSAPVLRGCTIAGNSAATEGGGIYCNGREPTSQ